MATTDRATPVPHDLSIEQALLGLMLLKPDAIRDITATVMASDFYLTKNAEVFAVLADAWQQGQPLDAVTLPARCPTLVTRQDAAEYLANAAMSHVRYCEQLVSLRVRREILHAAREIAVAARDFTIDPTDAVETATTALTRIQSPLAPIDDLWDVREFIAQTDHDGDWIIPGLFREGWRVILVAAEGVGKSTVSRQIAVAAAAGIHPLFQSQAIDPVRTLLVDLENPEQVVRKSLRRMESCAGNRLGDGMTYLWTRQGGVNLRTRDGRSKLEAAIAYARPRLVVLGPLYKAYNVTARESDEQAAGEVQAVLDELRTRYGFALLLEHHAPKASGRDGRDLMPYGSSLWLRWPEIGIRLIQTEKANGELTPNRLKVGRWRHDRVDNGWPQRIERGQVWPWIGEWDQANGHMGDTEELF